MGKGDSKSITIKEVLHPKTEYLESYMDIGIPIGGRSIYT